eukprot:scaffold26915_cov71-Attheya_sp.AAC.5
MRMKECGRVLKKGVERHFLVCNIMQKRGGNILEAEEPPLGVDYGDAVSIRGGQSLVVLEGGLEVEGGSAIIGSLGCGGFVSRSSGCGLGVAFGGPGAVGDAGAMAGFAVLGRWFHFRKVGRN